MVSVCNIDRWNFSEKLPDLLNFLLIVYDPDSVCDLILLGEIIHRSMLHLPALHQGKKLCRITACQKDRACIGITDIHMVNSVLLLVLSCQLMLFNDAVYIVVDGTDAYDSCLGFSLADQLIEIVVRFLVLDQCSLFLESVQIFSGFLINFWIIKVCHRIQIHLCSVYMEKRIWIFFPDLSCLLSVYYIVGKCSHALCLVRCRPHCLKCLK